MSSVVVTVKVLFFAASREAVDGKSQLDVALVSNDNMDDNAVTTNTLRTYLIQQFPKLSKYIHEDVSAITMALNEEYIPHGIVLPIKDGDVIAIIPPISGG
jgi:molybdopterin converting factor small subunit